MTDYTTLPAAPAVITTETATPSPSPTDDVLRPDLDADDVTPGVIGFVMTFLLALAGVAVWFAMNKKIRRLGYEERAAREGTDNAQPGGSGAVGQGHDDLGPDDRGPGDLGRGRGGSGPTA